MFSLYNSDEFIQNDNSYESFPNDNRELLDIFSSSYHLSDDEEFDSERKNEERYVIQKEKTININDNKQIIENQKLSEKETSSNSKINTNFTNNVREPSTATGKKPCLIVGEIFTITKEGKVYTENENETGNQKEEPENEINNDFQILGKKREFANGGKHNKFWEDNMTRKLKTKLFDSVLYFVNSSIKPVQIQNPNTHSKKIKYSKLFFMKINQKTIKDTSVLKNRALLNKKLKDIFSEDISLKMESYGLGYNRDVLSKIESQEIDGVKIQSKTLAILERTLLECLEHFRGTKYYDELKGLELEYDKVIDAMKCKGEEEEYIKKFKEFAAGFEKYYEEKKSRESKKKNS